MSNIEDQFEDIDEENDPEILKQQIDMMRIYFCGSKECQPWTDQATERLKELESKIDAKIGPAGNHSNQGLWRRIVRYFIKERQPRYDTGDEPPETIR